MVSFTCPNCNKLFNRKSNFEYHTYNKKRPCTVLHKKIEAKLAKPEPKGASPEPKFAKKKSFSDLKEVNYKNFIIQDDDIKMLSEALNPYILLSNDLNNFKNERYCCNYCGSLFSHKSSLTKHMKERCKKIKRDREELEILKEKLNLVAEENEKLKQEVSTLKDIKTSTTNINNKINNGTINNNSITVQLVQFGNENIDHIDAKEALDVYLKSTGGNIVSNILKLINLNEKYPQNHNICISDLSRELVKIFDGKKFIIKKFKNIKSDILSKLIKNTYKLLDKIENDNFIKKT